VADTGSSESAPKQRAAPPKPPDFYYCLEEGHPGAPSLQSSPVAIERIFAYSGEGCPVCPSCDRAVSAVPCQEEVPPQSIIELAGRMS
jgi:hypothetical protein